ncbi:MAG: DUF2293 domain-containing protein [Polyangiaceae bacterium]|nr:DUF2293 domain-containing protein [Myxococcales bacterium]MCB9588582.1 DUF2293 domain-containing protein [Polyangiaceae bacterium]
MPAQSRTAPKLGSIVAPGRSAREVKTEAGDYRVAPSDWVLVPPGDPALSRRIKAEGDHWLVQEKKGRKLFSRGIWAPKERVERITADLEVERKDPAYQRKLDAARAKRETEQAEYAEDFEREVFEFLSFAEQYADLAGRMAQAIAKHATPVGSGTVARTKRISIEERARAATIAWMRHQTTAYDDMKIPRVKGMRREVRRQLAQRSTALLGRYRRGEAIPAECPLKRALQA